MRFLLLILPFALLFAEEAPPSLCFKEQHYEVLSGSFPIKKEKATDEEKQAHISFISYHLKEPKQKGKRPVSFVFNGGPGSSSCWLHLGMLGPKRPRLPEEGASLTGPYEFLENEESILDLTDLVFVDPVGTGRETAATDKLDDKLPYYSVSGDMKSIGNFIRDYLTENALWGSPIYLIGESYGTSRCAALSCYLQSQHGIYLKGVTFVSSALDFSSLIEGNDHLLPFLFKFPSYVATAWHYGKYKPEAPLEEVLEEARSFIYEVYLPSLYQNQFSSAALEQMSKMTGLSSEFFQKNMGKVFMFDFAKELFAKENQLLSLYDTRYRRDLSQAAAFHFHGDPCNADIFGFFARGMHLFFQDVLGIKENYHLFEDEIFEKWNFFSKSFAQGGYPNFLPYLREAFFMNPELKLFVSSGCYDLVTPFAATEYTIQQLNLPKETKGKVTHQIYEGGHMFYINPKARKQFRQDLERFYADE